MDKPMKAVPKLDHYERGYNIRRLDNRVRVVISAHMGMSATPSGPQEPAHVTAKGCHFYVSYHVLVHREAETLPGEPEPVQWQYVPGSTTVGRTDDRAIGLALTYHEDAEKQLARLIPEWFAKTFPKLAAKML
jgi:hypothetical protein